MAGFVEIESPDDERLAPFRLRERGLSSRAERRDDAGAGLFLAEGDLVVDRAHRAGCRPFMALADADRVPAVGHRLAEQVDVFVGGDEIRQMVTGLGMPHPIVALYHRPARPSAQELLETTERLVVVEAVENPVNVGSIVRNAAALGWGGLLLDHNSADPLSRRALRVAMGTAFELPHARTTDLAGVLAGAGTHHQLLALTPNDAAVDIGEVRPAARRALLIGAERSGLSADLLRLAEPVRIPMAGG
ncbi:MAG: RNA methyltransferase, partial [Ilumatobacter sp.]|nr:RNA methyltransferase [Ilumatobacter sp.]